MDLKQLAAEAALRHIHSGMAVGLGSGSTAERFIEALGRALLRAGWLWQDPDQWNRVRLRGMAQDFSWERSARGYEEMYRAARESRGS